MSAITPVFSSPLVVASAAPRPPLAQAEPALGREDSGAGVSASTRVSLSVASAPVVYPKPSLPQRSTEWAARSDDSLSRQIESNVQAGSSLAQRFKGLGGALLTQFARTGEDYAQTLAFNVDRRQGLDAQLQGLREGAAEVTLQLKTRAGQSVELRMSSRGSGGADGVSGLQVQMSSQGPLGSSERQALGRLAEGLDKALAGLVQDGGPELALQDVLGFDRSQFASLRLEMKVPPGEGPQRSFSLQLGERENRLALKTENGEVNLRLDNAGTLANAAPAQRQAAIARQLRAVDEAGARGHADDATVALFKSAFAQMHGAALESVQANAPGVRAAPLHLAPALAARTQELVSGLADFEASFSSDASRLNDDGVLTEKSHTDYRLSQKTEVVQRRPGDVRVQQVLDMQLKATLMQARNGGMLIPGEGNYDVTQIDDRQTQRTTIEAVAGELVRAARDTERQQHTLWKRLEQHRAVEQRSTPDQQRFVELLI